MMKTTKYIFWDIYRRLKKEGIETSPRGMNTIEIENFNCVFPPYVRFCNFDDRKLSLEYIKREFLWYLKGDKADLSIVKHAKLWEDCVKDGVINSNYGQYIFGKNNQLEKTVKELIRDKDTRRATIVILQPYHLTGDEVDVPCTNTISFRIRDNKLNMTVKMRSQDAYFGFGSDIPCFSFIHEIMFNILREKYPSLKLGMYHHFVDSFHIYEKHFTFMNNVFFYKNKFEDIKCPKISNLEETKFLLNNKFKKIPDNYKFIKWLLDI